MCFLHTNKIEKTGQHVSIYIYNAPIHAHTYIHKIHAYLHTYMFTTICTPTQETTGDKEEKKKEKEKKKQRMPKTREKMPGNTRDKRDLPELVAMNCYYSERATDAVLELSPMEQLRPAHKHT